MDIDALIAKFLNGECSPEEIITINEWRQLSPENELIFEQSEDAWQLTNINRMYIPFNKENVWNAIRGKISRQYSLPVLLRVAGIAASVTLVLGWALTKIFSNNHSGIIEERPQLITLHVPAGVCSETILPDSTVVWLNASSMLRYPSYFDGDTRTIELIGEAFFEVTCDEAKPFIINSGNIRVDVLGTSFNFKHYREDTHAILAVEKGTVSLSAGATRATTLQAGKYATVDTHTLQTKVFDAPPGNMSLKNNQAPASLPVMTDKNKSSGQHSSWRNYTLIFRDEPVGNVLNELSRRYNAEFVLTGKDIRHYVYTATFDDMSLEDVLKLLKISSPIDYSITNITNNASNIYGKRKVTIIGK